MSSNDFLVDQKIFIGEYIVLSSGSLIIPSSNNIEFKFDNLTFRFVFDTEKDENGDLTEGHFSINLEKDEKSNVEFMKITMYNQNQSFFSSTESKLQLATLNGKRLYLKFCIHSINIQSDKSKEDKIFYYTWFLEK